MSDPRDSEFSMLRVPPQSVEAEQAVIGGLMLRPQALDLISDRLSESDFYRRDHRLIYRAIVELAEKGKPVDPVTMGEWFEAHGLADQIGGSGYLVELSSTTPSAANIRAYAEIVREKAILRQIIEAGTEAVNAGFNPEGRSALDVLGTVQDLFGDVLIAEPSELEPAAEVLKQMMDEQARRAELGGQIDGLATGFEDLDRQLCGLKPGQLIVIAGRPKSGKTTLAMNIAEHVAVVQGKRVAVHSLEMTPVQLIERSCCSLGRVAHNAVRHGDMDIEQWQAFTEASTRIRKADLLLSKPRSVRIDQLTAQTRREHAKKPLALLVIDYLQLINMDGAERRDIGVGDVTRKLKLLAVALGIPVILLSQLNRELEKRPDKRPIPSDLRDGGGIEQDADAVLFVYRDELYHKKSPDRGTAEIIIGLQRSGPPGMVRLQTRLSICRFDTLPDDWEPERFEEPSKAGGPTNINELQRKYRQSGMDRSSGVDG